MRPARLTRHEGVSCDACNKSNFTGDRFKCLVCFDFDLCRECYEHSALGNGGDHEADHPVQCIMTANDFDFAYWGEPASADELRCMSFVCPHCATAGFSLANLYEHVRVEHPHASYEVICPVCVCTPSADPNNMTDDLAAHLASEHINTPAAGGTAAPVAGYGAPSLTATSQRHFRARGRGRASALLSNGRSAATQGGRVAHARASYTAAAATNDARGAQVAEALQQLGASGGRSGNGYLRLLRHSLARREAGRSGAASGADRARLNVVSRDGHLIFSEWQQVESLLADASLADAWAEVLAHEQLAAAGQHEQQQSSQPARLLVAAQGAPGGGVVSGFATTVAQSNEPPPPPTYDAGSVSTARSELDAQLSAPSGYRLAPTAGTGDSSASPAAAMGAAAAATAILWPDERFLAPLSMQSAPTAEEQEEQAAARHFLLDLLASTLPDNDELT